MGETKVLSLVNRRKIKALEKNIKELGDITTAIKAAIQNLSQYNHYSNVRNRVNDMFVFYQELKTAKNKKIEILERLKNENME